VGGELKRSSDIIKQSVIVQSNNPRKGKRKTDEGGKNLKERKQDGVMLGVLFSRGKKG